MAIIEPIRIDGLRDLQAALKALDGESQKQLRVVLNQAAEIVVKGAQRRTPVKTGAARKTIKMASSQREARVKSGSAKVLYFGFLDYGGTTGRWPDGAHKRPFVKEGRIIYPAYWAQKDNILALLEKRIIMLAHDAGLAVGE